MSNPKAYVSVNKNRTKQYTDLEIGDQPIDHAVFLKDGTEFEIELDNPTSETYLAKIKLNGDFISNSGIVLRPGEHIYLERYLDNHNKFKFDTYSVPDRNKGATKNNGLVEVKFYREKKSFKETNPWDHIRIKNPDPTWPPYSPNDWYFYSDRGTGEPLLGSDSISSGSTTFSAGSADQSWKVESVSTHYAKEVENDEFETGRVTEGSQSNQSFNYVNKDFKNFHSSKSLIKILPVSHKPIQSREIRQYCPNCGMRFRKTWNFCAKCGEER